MFSTIKIQEDHYIGMLPVVRDKKASPHSLLQSPVWGSKFLFSILVEPTALIVDSLSYPEKAEIVISYNSSTSCVFWSSTTSTKRHIRSILKPMPTKGKPLRMEGMGEPSFLTEKKRNAKYTPFSTLHQLLHQPFLRNNTFFFFFPCSPFPFLIKKKKN